MASASKRVPHAKRRLLRRLLVLALAGALGLSAVELVLRASGRFQPNPPVWVGERKAGALPAHLGVLDEGLGWRLGARQELAATTPGHGGIVYRANAQGFRGDADFGPRTAGVRRVVFVGDSFTYGMGVELEATFPERTARDLDAAESCNLGLPGFGVDQMLCALELEGLALQPDLAVVCFIDNDIERCQQAYRDRGAPIAKPTFVLEKGALRPMRASDRPTALLGWLVRESRTFELGRRLERRLARRHGTGSRWRLARALFERMRERCEAAGVPLVVVRLPQRGLWGPAPGFARDFERLGIAYLDLEAQADETRDGELFLSDAHLSDAGHALVATELAAFLAQRAPFGSGR